MKGDLDNNLRDFLVAVSKGAVSSVPILGGPLAEAISVGIPNQRIDRVVCYIQELQKRVKELENDYLEKALRNADKLDMVEEGAYQAARALSGERILIIAEIVSRGISKEDSDIERHKRLLRILANIDNDGVALLSAYGQTYGGENLEAWDTVNLPGPAHLGSPTEDIDREKLYKAGKEHLLQLGLLEKRYPFVKQGGIPEFDTMKGEFKGNKQISYLGRMLLREIGKPSPIDTLNT